MKKFICCVKPKCRFDRWNKTDQTRIIRCMKHLPKYQLKKLVLMLYLHCVQKMICVYFACVQLRKACFKYNLNLKMGYKRLLKIIWIICRIISNINKAVTFNHTEVNGITVIQEIFRTDICHGIGLIEKTII